MSEGGLRFLQFGGRRQAQHAHEAGRCPGIKILRVDLVTADGSSKGDDAAAGEHVGHGHLVGLFLGSGLDDRAVDRLGPASPPPVGADRREMDFTVAALDTGSRANDCCIKATSGLRTGSDSVGVCHSWRARPMSGSAAAVIFIPSRLRQRCVGLTSTTSSLVSWLCPLADLNRCSLLEAADRRVGATQSRSSGRPGRRRLSGTVMRALAHRPLSASAGAAASAAGRGPRRVGEPAYDLHRQGVVGPADLLPRDDYGPEHIVHAGDTSLRLI